MKKILFIFIFIFMFVSLSYSDPKISSKLFGYTQIDPRTDMSIYGYRLIWPKSDMSEFMRVDDRTLFSRNLVWSKNIAVIPKPNQHCDTHEKNLESKHEHGPQCPNYDGTDPKGAHCDKDMEGGKPHKHGPECGTKEPTSKSLLEGLSKKEMNPLNCKWERANSGVDTNRQIIWFLPNIIHKPNQLIYIKQSKFQKNKKDFVVVRYHRKFMPIKYEGGDFIIIFPAIGPKTFNDILEMRWYGKDSRKYFWNNKFYPGSSLEPFFKPSSCKGL